MGTIFVFEFEESFHIKSISLCANSYRDALLDFSVSIGDYTLSHVVNIRKIS